MASDDWMSILAYYLQQQQGGKTPNFYNAPPTPGEEYDLARKKQVDSFAGPYIEQFLKGTSNLNPPDFKFMSPAMQGQTFAGGIKAPNIDFTKIPGLGTPLATGAPTTPTQPTTPFGGSSTGGSGSNPNAPDGGGAIEPQDTNKRRLPSLTGDVGSAFNSPQPFDRNYPGPKGAPSDPNDPNNAPGAGGEPTGAGLIKQAQTLAAQVKAGLKTIQQVFAEHPWLTKLGAAALGAIFGGPMGAITGAKGAGAIIDRFNRPQTPPVTQPLPEGGFPSTIKDRRFTPGAP